MDSIVVILLAMLIYLPGTTTGSLVRIGVVLFAYLVTPRRARFGNERDISSITRCMVVSPFIPLVFVAMSGGINTATVAHEVMRMIYCALLIMSVSKLYISFNVIYLAALVAFIPNFAIQVLEYIHFPGIIGFIQQHYVTDPATNLVHLQQATYTGADFRSGSVFINPNVYMVIPMISMCVFFYRDRTKPSLLNTCLIVATLVSGLLTGSRTSIVVMATIMVIYYSKYSTGTSKLVMFAIIAVAAVKYGSGMLSNSRALQLADTSSFDAKYMSFIWYWQRTASMPLLWFTGSLGSYMTIGMDSEWGYIYAWYGIFGIMWYLRYINTMWKNNRNIKFYSKLITISCAMVAMTATVLLCMPVYSFAGLVAFSHLRENERISSSQYRK